MKPKILIVTKSTKKEFYEFEHGYSVNEYYEKHDVDVKKVEAEHEQHYDSLKQLETILKQKDISFQIVRKTELYPELLNRDWNYVIAHGGDGTVLSTARYILNDIPFFGITSTDFSVGFHCSLNNKNIEQGIERLLKQDYQISSRKRTMGIIDNGEHHVDHALNEIVVSDKYFVGFAKLDIYLDNQLYHAGCSGLIASTYDGKSGWFDNVKLLEKDPKIIEKYEQAHLSAGLQHRDVICLDAEFKPEERESGIVRYKTIMGNDLKKNLGYEYGIIKPGQELVVVSRILVGGVASFDGNKPDGRRNRAYDLYYGSPVRIKLSDKPINIVKFE